MMASMILGSLMLGLGMDESSNKASELRKNALSRACVQRSFELLKLWE